MVKETGTKVDLCCEAVLWIFLPCYSVKDLIWTLGEAFTLKFPDLKRHGGNVYYMKAFLNTVLNIIHT